MIFFEFSEKIKSQERASEQDEWGMWKIIIAMKYSSYKKNLSLQHREWGGKNILTFFNRDWSDFFYFQDDDSSYKDANHVHDS